MMSDEVKWVFLICMLL